MSIEADNQSESFHNHVRLVVEKLGEHPIISATLFFGGVAGIAAGAEISEPVASITEMTLSGVGVFVGAVGLGSAMTKK